MRWAVAAILLAIIAAAWPWTQLPAMIVGLAEGFAVAMLDGKNNGVVISSLHTREGTRVYAKPVKAGEADGFPLTEEEKATIEEAKLSAREKKV